MDIVVRVKVLPNPRWEGVKPGSFLFCLFPAQSSALGSSATEQPPDIIFRIVYVRTSFRSSINHDVLLLFSLRDGEHVWKDLNDSFFAIETAN